MMNSLLNPVDMHSVVIVMLALFAKDLVVGALRAFAKKLLTDKNKNNDALGIAADVLADSVEKIKK